MCASIVLQLLVAFTFTVAIRKTNASKTKKDLNIMGLLPMTGTIWPGGNSCLPAVEMAIEDVHATDGLLDDYRLNYIWLDTKCDPSLAVDAMYKLLHTPPTKLLFLCCVCSHESVFTAQASHLWNINQIAYGSSASKLSNRTLFPRFFRLAIPDTTTNQARIKLFSRFNWERIGLIDQAHVLYKSITDDLKRRLKDTNITIVSKEIFENKPVTQMANLKNQDVRVILAGSYMNQGRQILCEAYKLGMYGRSYAWFFPKAFGVGWWEPQGENLDCTENELLKAAEGHFLTTYNYRNHIEERGPANLTASEWEVLLAARRNHSDTAYALISPLCYDAVWVAALALDRADKKMKQMNHPKTLDQFEYHDVDIANIITSEIGNTNFTGIMGHVAFGGDGDPLASLRIMQMNDGLYRWVGTYNPMATGEKIQWENGGIRWAGKKPPRDRTIVIQQYQLPLMSEYIPRIILASLGIILGLALLTFNTRFRKHKIIKMSSPNINNVMLLGCILTCSSVYMRATISTTTDVLCKMQTFLFTVGFSIMFGSLFSKMWRVNKIFSNKKLRRMKIKDSQLLVFVLLLLGINVTILVVWEVMDPQKVQYVGKDVQESADDNGIVIQPVTDICVSRLSVYFTVTLYTIQGALLSFGSFLAWSTRNVKVDELNDSRLVGMCIYNVVILSAIGLTLTMVMGNKWDAIDQVSDGFVVVGTSLTQLILFIPKIVAVMGRDNVGQMMLHLESILDTKGEPAHFIHDVTTNKVVKNNHAPVNIDERKTSMGVPSGLVHVIKGEGETSRGVTTNVLLTTIDNGDSSRGALINPLTTMKGEEETSKGDPTNPVPTINDEGDSSREVLINPLTIINSEKETSKGDPANPVLTTNGEGNTSRAVLENTSDQRPSENYEITPVETCV
ncbi:hypothetical protein ScPMuIL_015858 [Solemya velum]